MWVPELKLTEWTWKDTLSVVIFIVAAVLITVIYNIIRTGIEYKLSKHSDPTKKRGKDLTQEELIRKYEKTKDDHKRKELVGKINDPEVLKRIALNDPYTPARCLAVVKIDDQQFLSSIAENDGEPLVRNEAVRKISDQAVLERIAVHDGTNYVRQAAVMGIKDAEFLKKFALGQDDATAAGAVRVIEDRAFLEQLVKAPETSEAVRKAAVQRLKNLPE